MEATKGQTFKSYAKKVKIKLVKHYNWSIEQANQINQDKLFQCYLNHYPIAETCCKILGVKQQDLFNTN